MRRFPLCLAVTMAVAAQSLSAQVTARRPFLFKDARSEMAAARARGDADVLLVIASMPGANERVATLITAWGGDIQFRQDAVDYLRARVPVDSVEVLVVHPDVHSLDVSKPSANRLGRVNSDGAAPLPAESALPTMQQDTLWPPMLGDQPLSNRYSPLGDLNALGFLEKNPTFDGRGVTIALIDGNPDPLLPELQVATSLDGQSIPKIAIYETVVDAEEEPDGRWVPMSDEVVATGTQFTFDSTAYTAPHSGTFRIGMFDEAWRDSLGNLGMDGDMNRDGNPEGSSRLFAVLWSEGTNDVWVDTDQDQDFSDETALTDYNDRPVFGVLGTDDPETPIRESVAFGIQTDAAKQMVGLNLGVESHASLVVGAAVASRGETGRFDGVAPGARLASVSEGGASYGQTEALIVAIMNPAVDLAYLEQSSRITRAYLLRDGRLVPTVIYGRLIAKYRKPIIVPTHNYPILGGIDDFVLAPGAIGINGHESKENFFLVHGVRVEHDDNLLITGGYGPMGNGAFQPDVISPSNYISTWRGFQEGRAMAGLFQLPPGYTVAGGTSTATPTAAGAVALLISAAKQSGVPYDAFKIKQALTMSARNVPHLPSYKQGNGVIDVARAWDLLQAMAAAPEVTITSRASVRHVFSHLLPTPHEGLGLYERDGWNVGDSAERTVTFTRTSGPDGPMTFTLGWVGNDSATYSAPATVTLPLNTPVPTTIGVAPSTPGVHTAILTLDHESIPGHAHRMLMAVVAAQPLIAADSFTIEQETEVPRPGMRSFFYRVPAGVNALKVDLEAPERAVSLAVIRPDTRAESTRGLGSEAGSTSFVVNEPMAGLWEIRLTDVADTRTFDWEQAKKPEPVPPTEATLTLTAYAAEVVATETGGMTHHVSISNGMAKLTASAMSLPLGSAHRERPTIRHTEQQMFAVEVLPGSPFLLARVRGVSDPDADLDVYVYDCTEERCSQAASDADPLGDETVLVRNPAAGTWKIVVDAHGVPSGSTTYEYLDVVFNPSYGSVAVTDTPDERGMGAQWATTAHTWTAPMEHAPGRAPFAAVLIQGQPKGGDAFLVTLQELVAGVATATESGQR
ncbi:MAG: S8 family serine peptidase [Gemmatimonadetes bacterium]|nr:S8 family serine peptidase [Gemmatimonadota bacterium]